MKGNKGRRSSDFLLLGASEEEEEEEEEDIAIPIGKRINRSRSRNQQPIELPDRFLGLHPRKMNRSATEADCARSVLFGAAEKPNRSVYGCRCIGAAEKIPICYRSRCIGGAAKNRSGAEARCDPIGFAALLVRKKPGRLYSLQMADPQKIIFYTSRWMMADP
jgi:sugar (pentulose or hexulose) kinase